MPDTTLETLRYLDLPSEVRDFLELDDAESAVLARVNQKVAAGRSLAEVMDLVFEETLAISPCDRLGLAFVEEDGARLVATWVRATYEPLLLNTGYAEDVRGSSLAAVLAGGRPRIIDDLEAYLRDRPSSRSTRILVEEGVRSSMTCPLTVEGRPVGLFFRSSRRPHAYDERHVRLHLAIAERLAQAVEKARRIEQLEAATAAYTEMLGFVAHELKSPLAAIVMDARALTGGYVGELQPEQARLVERMVAKATFLNGLVRDYLDLARVESGELKLQALDGVAWRADVLDPALDVVRPQLEEAASRLVVTGDDEARLTCDPALLQVVVVNLLSNAVKYGNRGGEIVVTARTDDATLRVVVWNEGPGYPETERARLFRRFSRLQTPDLLRRKGTGVGLYTCWRIVQLHDGRMAAASEHGRWAQFSFEVPLRPHPPA